MPFADHLEIKIPWLFYPVPNNFVPGINTVFTDRFYDDRDHWIPPGVGVVPDSMRRYVGPIPTGPVTPIVGTPDQWMNGLDYETWLADGYAGTPCWPIHSYLLQENRRLILQEDGSRIQLET
jgi:hypothetical protein